MRPVNFIDNGTHPVYTESCDDAMPPLVSAEILRIREHYYAADQARKRGFREGVFMGVVCTVMFAEVMAFFLFRFVL